MISQIPSLGRPLTTNSTPRMSAIRILADVATKISQRCKLSPPVASTDLDALSTAVSELTADDLAVYSSDYQSISPSRPIFYIPVAEQNEFVMAVFVMPPGSKIPLHDHSQMYVASSVLWGTLNVSSYDWTSTQKPFWMKKRQAKRYNDFQLTRGMVKTLTPTNGNIHSFLAMEWTAVFDVVVPPYNDSEGRSCRYYEQVDKQFPLNDTYYDAFDGKNGNSDLVYLREVDCPDSYQTITEPYKGEKVFD